MFKITIYKAKYIFRKLKTRTFSTLRHLVRVYLDDNENVRFFTSKKKKRLNELYGQRNVQLINIIVVYDIQNSRDLCKTFTRFCSF